jgi:hypothetical protein
MNLTSATQTIEVITSAALSGTVSAFWTDIDKTAATVILPGSAVATITTATTTTLVAAPAANIYRQIAGLSYKNNTLGNQTVTFQKDVGGTNYPLAQAVLAINESLHFESGQGWYVLDATGSRKGIGATGAAGVNGGGTILGSGTSLLDFGAGTSHTTLVVTGQPLILAGSLVYVWVKPETTPEHSADEHLVETLKVFASDIVAGTGFTIHGLNTSELFEPLLPEVSLLGRFSGAGQNTGPGQQKRLRVFGGRGTLISGRYSVGWLYTQ